MFCTQKKFLAIFLKFLQISQSNLKNVDRFATLVQKQVQTKERKGLRQKSWRQIFNSHGLLKSPATFTVTLPWKYKQTFFTIKTFFFFYNEIQSNSLEREKRKRRRKREREREREKERERERERERVRKREREREREKERVCVRSNVFALQERLLEIKFLDVYSSCSDVITSPTHDFFECWHSLTSLVCQEWAVKKFSSKKCNILSKNIWKLWDA